MTRIVVTGLGLITSLGVGSHTNWRAMLEGKDGGSEIPYFDTSQYRVHRAHVVREVPSERFAPPAVLPADFALTAAREALASSGLDLSRLRPERVGLALGTLGGELRTYEAKLREHPEQKEHGYSAGFASVSPVSRISAIVAERLSIEGPVLTSINACSSANHALAASFELLQEGRVDAMIVAGADTVTQTGFTYFHNLRSLASDRVQPFDKNRQGLMIGEGAGVLILEPYDQASRRGAKIYAEVLGYGLSSDGYHVTSPHPEGRGAIEVMQRALASAGLEPEQIDYVNAHGTATPANDYAEALALSAVFCERARALPVSSTKSMIGHCMGASSAIESVVCCLALESQVAPPTINFETPDPNIDLDVIPGRARAIPMKYVLNNSFAFGGNNASVIFGKV